MTEVLIDSIGQHGDGIAEIGGERVFVPFTLPGERVEIAREGERGTLLSIIAPSAERAEPISPYFGACGGCSLQHLNRASYAAFKRGLVVTALAHAGVEAEVAPLIDATGVGRRRATLHALAPKAVPRVSPALRPGPGAPKPVPASNAPNGQVVYFPSCATRMFGAPTRENGLLPTTDAMIELMRRAGFDPVVPEKLEGQCCGQPFLSKGFPEEAERVGGSTRRELDGLSQAGALPVVTDASTCAKHMREHPGEAAVMDSAEFLIKEILPRLTITKPLPAVAVHHNCSAQRLKEQGAIEALAAVIAEKVVVLDAITCCGYAGDKGLYVPELNAHATRFAKAQIPAGCEIGLSTVSTCATGLSERMGIPFVSIASLLEMVSQPAT